jgi:hypothetical protein
MKGFLFAIFVLMSLIIVFLAFQVNDNSQRCTNVKMNDQEMIAKSTKLMISSAQQNHPLLAFESAFESKYIIEDIVQRHGSVMTAEKALKLETNQLKKLRDTIHKQYQFSSNQLMEQEITKNPNLDVPENEMAKMTTKKKKKKSSHRSDN